MSGTQIALGSAAESITAHPDGSAVFVGTQGGVARINTANNGVTSASVGGLNTGLAFNEASNRLYLGDLTANDVFVVDATSLQTVDSLLGVGAALSAGACPCGTKIFFSDAANNRLGEISTITNQLVGSIASDCGYLSILPNGATVYSTSVAPNTLNVVNTLTNNISEMKPTGVGPAPIDAAFVNNRPTVLVPATFSNVTNVFKTATIFAPNVSLLTEGGNVTATVSSLTGNSTVTAKHNYGKWRTFGRKHSVRQCFGRSALR